MNSRQDHYSLEFASTVVNILLHHIKQPVAWWSYGRPNMLPCKK